MVGERERDRFGPAAGVEFGQDVAHVELDGGPVDHQPLRNLGVVKSPDQEGEYLALPGR